MVMYMLLASLGLTPVRTLGMEIFGSEAVAHQ